MIPIRRLLLILLLAGLAATGWACGTATSDPLARETEVALARWPRGEPPVRALLISDIHVAGPDMPPRRLERIVAQLAALRRKLSHSPDPFPSVPGDVGLMLAGHRGRRFVPRTTLKAAPIHCGQIRLPIAGALSTRAAER